MQLLEDGGGERRCGQQIPDLIPPALSRLRLTAGGAAASVDGLGGRKGRGAAAAAVYQPDDITGRVRKVPSESMWSVKDGSP